MMTKNAITVIDQELIDWFENEFVVDINNPAIVTAQVEELLNMAKDLIEINAELRKQQEWISVEDELPENDTYVLACFDGDSIDVDYTDVCPDLGHDYFVNYMGVTHWMPLPTPPEGE